MPIFDSHAHYLDDRFNDDREELLATLLNTTVCGIIENGTADQGGNIYATANRAVVNIQGGIIRGGDVYIDSTVKSVTVGGAAVIETLDLSSGKLLTVGELNLGADITVKAADGTFTETCLKAEKFEAYFKAQAAEKVVKAESNALVIAAAE